MLIAVLLAMAILYAACAFAIGIIAAQCLSTIRGTDAENKLKTAIAKTKRSKIVGFHFWSDGHPMDTRVWFALRDAESLPGPAQRKAKTIGSLYSIVKFSWIGLWAALFATAVLTLLKQQTG